jgi:adenylylsulfate kinase
VFPTSTAAHREKKERLLGQRGRVIWLFGHSGAGKSTMATALECQLLEAGRLTTILDGDNLRSGLNHGLGFTDPDRSENIRRVAEVARLFAQSGVIAICACITPHRSHRRLVREIVGARDLCSVYIGASFETCARRDPKGLYARAATGGISHFTGRDSIFEPPDAQESSTWLSTEDEGPEETIIRLWALVAKELLT